MNSVARLLILLIIGVFADNLIAAETKAIVEKKKNSATNTKAIMHSLLATVSELIPLSISGNDFRSPPNQQKVLGHLKKLALHAQTLENHGKSQDKGFAFISQSLAKDTKEILYWYKLKRYDEAQFVFNNLTENCIACHSQRSGPENLPATAKFFQYVKIKNLPLVEKAQMQVAMRQFDDALANYEAFFASNEMTPTQLALMEAFSDYLKLCIRVKGDLMRPIPVLEKWAKREGVPDFMQANIKEWIGALKEINNKKLMANSDVDSAKKLMALAQKEPTLTLDRSKLVYFISASGVLMRVVATAAADGSQNSQQFGEAYYLLGICESVIGRKFWLSQTDFFLEAAIRAAPGSEVAKKSYSLLEEQVSYEFSGSSGTRIPDDMRTLLKELKDLSNKSK